MVVFYRGPCVRITHEVFETWCPTYRSFALRALRGLSVVEHTATGPTAVRPVRTLSTSVAGAVAVAAGLGWAGGWQVFDQPLVAVTTVALLAAALLIATACWRIRPLAWELVGVYRGRPVRLFRTTDARTMGEVRRGLIRALDWLDDTVPSLPIWASRQ